MKISRQELLRDIGGSAAVAALALRPFHLAAAADADTFHVALIADTTYGPQHLVMASTRYDPHAYLVVEANVKTGRHELVNLDLVGWNTHFSAPYASER